MCQALFLTNGIYFSEIRQTKMSVLGELTF